MLNAILDKNAVSNKISKHDWIKLRDLYHRNWPKHILSFYTLKTYIKWIEKDPKLNITIFTTDENWTKHGTYVLVDINGTRSNIFFNTLNVSKTADLLFKALKRIQEDGILTLTAFVEQVRPVAEDFLKHLGIEDFQSCVCDQIIYYLPRAEALQLANLPKTVYHIKPLTLDDVPLIDSLWPQHFTGSVEYLQSIIRHNFTLGAYEQQSGKLCGWIMQEKTGTIGPLQVVESHKRNGIGELLIRQMAVLMANDGLDPAATVTCVNRPSRHIFQKLGFKIIDHLYRYNKTPVEEPEVINDIDISQLLLEVDCL